LTYEFFYREPTTEDIEIVEGEIPEESEDE
jgi:hypothetical protein